MAVLLVNICTTDNVIVVQKADILALEPQVVLTAQPVIQQVLLVARLQGSAQLVLRELIFQTEIVSVVLKVNTSHIQAEPAVIVVVLGTPLQVLVVKVAVVVIM